MAKYNNSQNNIDINSPVTLSGAGNVNATLANYIIGVDNTDSARTVTIPTASTTGAAANKGKVYLIKDQSGAAGINNITIQPTTGTIDGATSISINSNFGEAKVYSSGVDWFRVLVSAGGTAFNSISIQEFNASGTYTPTTGMRFCIVELIGGGGGGGGASTGSGGQVSAGAGGGSGGYVKALLTATQISISQAITIGTGGSAGNSSGTGGGAGGITSLGALLSATGGGFGAGNQGGGFQAASTTGGIGGTPTVSTGIDMGSATGGPGVNGKGSISAGNGAASGGYGGTLRFGGAGNSGTAVRVLFANGSSSTGVSGAANTGSGAGGAISVGDGATARAGGTGGAGIVLITEFINIP